MIREPAAQATGPFHGGRVCWSGTKERVVRVPFLDLRVIDADERAELLEAVEGVLRHGRLVLGPEVEAFERRIAGMCGRRYAVGVGSGTDALFIGLRAAGIGSTPGSVRGGERDEVITTGMSWIATANAIVMSGALPVFADVGEDLNIDPASVRSLITPRTRAILAVHNQGRLADVAALRGIADRHGLMLIEDAAQAFGARGSDGRAAGAFGEVGCMSMNPMKVLAALGEAGAIVTDDPAIAERAVALRYNGTVHREDCHWPSLNGRLDTLQAAMLLRRLDRLEGVLARRRSIAMRYHRGLAEPAADGRVRLPIEHERLRPLGRDVYYTYTVQLDGRDELMRHLESHGIESRVRHPIILPGHTAYRAAARGRWDRAAVLVDRMLCLPVHEKMSDEQVEHVIASVRSFFG